MKTIALSLAAAAFSFAAAAADRVAFVTDLQGNATIEGDGKVAFLAELPAGTRLLLGSGAKVSITYASTGAEFTLSGPGEFMVENLEVKAEKGAPPAKRMVSMLQDVGLVARVSRTATASVRMRNVQAPPTRPSLDFPVDTRVTTLQPDLRWTGARDGAQISLRDADGKEIWKGPAQPDATKPPMKLSASTRYRWTVMTANGSLQEAQFETLGEEALSRAARSRAASQGFSERVVHAMLLQELGATQEARAAWADLARQRPDLPELAALAR